MLKQSSSSGRNGEYDWNNVKGHPALALLPDIRDDLLGLPHALKLGQCKQFARECSLLLERKGVTHMILKLVASDLIVWDPLVEAQKRTQISSNREHVIIVVKLETRKYIFFDNINPCGLASEEWLWHTDWEGSFSCPIMRYTRICKDDFALRTLQQGSGSEEQEEERIGHCFGDAEGDFASWNMSPRQKTFLLNFDTL